MNEQRFNGLTSVFLSTACVLLGWAVSSPPANAALTFFSSRSAFEAANPGLAIEDFEEGVPNITFGSPLDNTSNNGAFSPGDILPGVAISNNPGDFLLVLSSVGGGTQPLPSQVLFQGGDTGSSSLDISFSVDVFATGLDIYLSAGASTPLIAGETTVSVFGDSGLLGSQIVTTSDDGPIFFGVTSDSDRITLVNVDGFIPAVFSFEGIDNLTFVPEPGAAFLLLTWGLIGSMSRRWRRG